MRPPAVVSQFIHFDWLTANLLHGRHVIAFTVEQPVEAMETANVAVSGDRRRRPAGGERCAVGGAGFIHFHERCANQYPAAIPDFDHLFGKLTICDASFKPAPEGSA
ncbi:hypothetical protein F2P81_025410 [Scophthalmus maximus]|uniref:Uncharacterized protein n=1 Tax=Scophthalmus maximus TaxID=52904 RepID=A0A6A4RQ99_SCOMX|nr:hypothetical protein F2P81_025410 [Scophthalmus maximus]